MKCLDNIYTKQIKYNSPVLYQLESLKKEYEKLLKVSNEIIKTGSFIEECYFENQSAVLSDNEITFNGNLKFKTDAGNYFQNIPSSLKLNVQGSGEIVVDVGEDKTLVFKLDEEFLSEISLMIENLESLTDNFETLKQKFESQIFDNFIGIRNTADSKIDQIKHINNNFQITSSDGKSLLNIDEQLEKISSFNKDLLTTDNLERIEQVEIIYDMDSNDQNINLGYTGGLVAGIELPINADKYKYLKINYVCFDYTLNNIGATSNILLLNLKKHIDNVSIADSVSGLYANNQVAIEFDIRVHYNHIPKTLSFLPYHAGNIQNSQYYYISSIQGVY